MGKMTISKKQLEANRKNSKKGGVKTEAGKEVVKFNAVKHGLLAKEVIVTVGDGAEDPVEFLSLWDSLKQQLKPKGTLEDLLLEKIACFFWRLRRAYRYEVGLIRQNLDTIGDDFYSGTDFHGNRSHKTNESIDEEIRGFDELRKAWNTDKTHFQGLQKKQASLDTIFEWEENWELLFDDVGDDLNNQGINSESMSPGELYKSLKEILKWSDNQIWEKLIIICDKQIQFCDGKIQDLERSKEKNALQIQVARLLGGMPGKLELEKLLRYETTIERQLYKALDQLERLQRMRKGDFVPPPIEGSLNVQIN